MPLSCATRLESLPKRNAEFIEPMDCASVPKLLDGPEWVYEIKGRDLTRLPLSERRELMKSYLKFYSPRIRIAEQFEATASDMLSAVRQQQLEGVIGKRKDSQYEAGKRTGSWVKCRVNRGQELVIGGYMPGPHGFDSLIVGYYRGEDFVYVAHVRNGFVPASRRQVFEKIRKSVTLSPLTCPS